MAITTQFSFKWHFEVLGVEISHEVGRRRKRGGGVTNEVNQNWPKWSPYYDPSMTKQKWLKLVQNGYYNPIFIQPHHPSSSSNWKKIIRGIEGWWFAHRVHKNVPEWSPHHDKIKLFLICPHCQTQFNFHSNGHFKGDRSQNQSSEGVEGSGLPMGFTKWNKMITLAWQSKCVFILSKVADTIQFSLKRTLKRE